MLLLVLSKLMPESYNFKSVSSVRKEKESTEIGHSGVTNEVIFFGNRL